MTIRSACSSLHRGGSCGDMTVALGHPVDCPVWLAFADGSRQVPLDEALKFADSNDLAFMETSAKTDVGVSMAFSSVVQGSLSRLVPAPCLPRVPPSSRLFRSATSLVTIAPFPCPLPVSPSLGTEAYRVRRRQQREKKPAAAEGRGRGSTPKSSSSGGGGSASAGKEGGSSKDSGTSGSSKPSASGSRSSSSNSSNRSSGVVKLPPAGAPPPASSGGGKCCDN